VWASVPSVVEASSNYVMTKFSNPLHLSEICHVWPSDYFYFVRQPHDIHVSCPLSFIRPICTNSFLTQAAVTFIFIQVWNDYIQFFGAFAKLRKATITFVTSVCLSVRSSAWNNFASTGRTFMKFDVWVLFWKTTENIQVPLKTFKNNGYFAWRYLYIYHKITVSSS
jgi:hypothetical protein